MNIDIVQLLQGGGLVCPPPEPIDSPGWVPTLYDVRAARELQPILPPEGSVPALWDEGCPPMETWYMGYLYSHTLARMQYAQELMVTLSGMLQAGTVPVGVIPIVLLVINGLEYQYKPEDIVWYEGRLQDISTKLSKYYQPPISTDNEGVPHEV